MSVDVAIGIHDPFSSNVCGGEVLFRPNISGAKNAKMLNMNLSAKQQNIITSYFNAGWPSSNE
jgi:hypothetical protein